jgi:hypothetical protein
MKGLGLGLVTQQVIFKEKLAEPTRMSNIFASI